LLGQQKVSTSETQSAVQPKSGSQQVGSSVQTVANDLNMLVSTGGRQRSETEFRSLYADAGFRLTRIVATLATVSVIEGAPA